MFDRVLNTHPRPHALFLYFLKFSDAFSCLSWNLTTRIKKYRSLNFRVAFVRFQVNKQMEIKIPFRQISMETNHVDKRTS